MNNIFVNMHIVLFCALVWFKRYTLESTVHCSVIVMIVEENPTIEFFSFFSHVESSNQYIRCINEYEEILLKNLQA